MVDVTGHLGMALLFAAPAWVVWDRRGALGFTAFALLTAMLPDADLFLQPVLPVTHHGVTHTLVFVIVISVLAATIAAKWLTDWLNANGRIRSTTITNETVFVFATAGLTVGGVSHLFADLLSAPDIAAPLSPFWPFYSEPVIIDVIYYDSPFWNFGLITAGVLLHLALARYGSYPLDTRYRIGDREGDEGLSRGVATDERS